MGLRTILTNIFQLEVSMLTVRQVTVFFQGDTTRQTIVVGTIVRDIQLTIAITLGKVSTTIEATGMFGTNGDKVTVIAVIERGCGITKHRGSIRIMRITV